MSSVNEVRRAVGLFLQIKKNIPWKGKTNDKTLSDRNKNNELV